MATLRRQPAGYPPLMPKKELGQHWLRDRGILAAIADDADITTNDTVLEIGPGLGTLTSELLRRAGRVVAAGNGAPPARQPPPPVPGKRPTVFPPKIPHIRPGQEPHCSSPRYPAIRPLRTPSRVHRGGQCAVLYHQQDCQYARHYSSQAASRRAAGAEGSRSANCC